MQRVTYGEGEWPVQGRGNHRAIVRVSDAAAAAAAAVRVRIPWRRHDPEPALKAVLVIDEATGERVRNAVAAVHAEYGDLVFEPVSGSGDYSVYFMPFTDEGWQHQPSVRYLPPESSADEDWATAHLPLLTRGKEEPESPSCDGTEASVQPQGPGAQSSYAPEAEVVALEAVNAFHRMDPMEVPATAAEVAALVTRYPGRSYLVFPEDRGHSIRMRHAVPLRWIDRGVRDAFHGHACRGEFYVLQLGVFAARGPLQGIDAGWTALVDGRGHEIPAGAITCTNTRGVDWSGRTFQKRLSLKAGEIQPLWIGLQVPADAQPGQYTGQIAVHVDGHESTPVELRLAVHERLLPDAGDSDLGRLARLRWLDSTKGIDEDAVPPYTSLRMAGDRIEMLGRALRVGVTGLPSSITTRFDRSVQNADGPEQEMLAKPVRVLVQSEGAAVELEAGDFELVRRGASTAAWTATAHGEALRYRCTAVAEADGYVTTQVELTALRQQNIQDVRLEIPLRPEFARYIMGMGRKGGKRRGEWHWKWSPDRANHMIWLGAVHGGLHCKLMFEQDVWELHSLVGQGLPDAWCNGGRGGCDVLDRPGHVELVAYSGARTLAEGQRLVFRFGLLITPFHALSREHWDWRYFGQSTETVTPVEEVEAAGARVIHLHHANPLNPHINYPFTRTRELKRYVDAAHARGMRVVLYYTVRELSNYAAELWAFRSLGDEIYRTGEAFRLADHFLDSAAVAENKEDHRPPGLQLPGGSWLWEHLGGGFVPAWHHPLDEGVQDAAIATQGMSRLHNYYIEGLEWLVQNLGIDGLYLDGIGYDRQIMKRVRKVLQRAQPNGLITFHSGNNYHPEYGMNSPAVQYLEHLPYCDSIWFGEGYDYDEAPDYWLVEISGIPFGVAGEMLQNGGNLWRGMLYYGMGNRLGWNSASRPESLWKYWDERGIAEMEMVGYWDVDCPVRTGRDDVLATVYRGSGRAIVALASWSQRAAECDLEVDWEALGQEGPVTLQAASIPGFQEARTFPPGAVIPLTPGKGWLLEVPGR